MPIYQPETTLIEGASSEKAAVLRAMRRSSTDMEMKEVRKSLKQLRNGSWKADHGEFMDDNYFIKTYVQQLAPNVYLCHTIHFTKPKR